MITPTLLEGNPLVEMKAVGVFHADHLDLLAVKLKPPTIIQEYFASHRLQLWYQPHRLHKTFSWDGADAQGEALNCTRKKIQRFFSTMTVKNMSLEVRRTESSGGSSTELLSSEQLQRREIERDLREEKKELDARTTFYSENSATNPAEEHYVVVAMGSNLGNRVRHLENALRLIHATEGVQVRNMSSLYESAAQPKFVEGIHEAKSSAIATAVLTRNNYAELGLSTCNRSSSLYPTSTADRRVSRSRSGSCIKEDGVGEGVLDVNIEATSHLQSTPSTTDGASSRPDSSLSPSSSPQRRIRRPGLAADSMALAQFQCSASDERSAPYLNACCSLSTTLSPVALLSALQEVEVRSGRQQMNKHIALSEILVDEKDFQDDVERLRYLAAARPVDLDILLYDDSQLGTSTSSSSLRSSSQVVEGNQNEAHASSTSITSSLDLQIPHPRMLFRDFVLKPLQELLRADERQSFRHPVTGAVLCDLSMPDGGGGPLRYLPGLGTSASSAFESPGRLLDTESPEQSSFSKSGMPFVLGILNTTPDSFSDGGLFLASEAAVRHARKMRDEGCDLVDVGGESSRPGAETVTVEDELARVVPVFNGLRNEDIPFSSDTRKAEVARVALQAGATCINDVSFGRYYEENANAVDETAEGTMGMKEKNPMFQLLSEAVQNIRSLRGLDHDESPDEASEFFYIGMHMRGDFKSMDFLTDYSTPTSAGSGSFTSSASSQSQYINKEHKVREIEKTQIKEEMKRMTTIVGHLNSYFEKRLKQLWLNYGVPSWRVVCDPGLGFAKTPEQSLDIVKHAHLLHRPLQCYGHSRKRFVSFAQGTGAVWLDKKKQLGHEQVSSCTSSSNGDTMLQEREKQLAKKFGHEGERRTRDCGTLPGNLGLCCVLYQKQRANMMLRVHDVLETKYALQAFATGV
ncbi:unnamed protein product [Amoebophrya sp. A25]|nr:unnamed protein product [Amoebophrya sp. A25]|eukprot:GSA25T00015674001.1